IREGRWLGRLARERDDMMKAAKRRFPEKAQRQQWVYGELDRMYPPLAPTPMAYPGGGSGDPGATPMAYPGGQIQGLGDIPEDWPELASNASLGAELAWVQANRLWIVEERPGRATLVRLDRAASPSPSRAA